jgi:hemerythrin-like domain-containing protein
MHGSAVEGTVPRKTTRKGTTTRRNTTRAVRKRSTKGKRGVTTARRKTAARSAATRKRRRSAAPKPSSRVATAAAVVKGTLAGAISTVADKLPWVSAEPDALDLLERDHRRFEALLAQGEETTERARKTRRKLLATLAAELNEHELKEEKVLYPALQSRPETRNIVLEGFEEHHVADLVVKELRDVATNDEAWGAKFKVLKESIEHHIQEEEREMFRAARSLLSRDELRDLASRMRALNVPSRHRSSAAKS